MSSKMSKFQSLLLQSLRRCSLQPRKEMATSKEMYDRRCWTVISDGPKAKSLYEEFLTEELDRVIEKDSAKFCAVCLKRANPNCPFPDFENGHIVRAAYFCDLHSDKVKKIRTATKGKLLYDIVKQLRDEES